MNIQQEHMSRHFDASLKGIIDADIRHRVRRVVDLVARQEREVNHQRPLTWQPFAKLTTTNHRNHEQHAHH